MGRKRQPLEVLRFTGSYKGKPGKVAQREAEEEALEKLQEAFPPLPSEPPDHLDAEEKKAWRQFLAAVPPGWYNASDGLILEHVAVLVAAIRRLDHRDPENRQLINGLHSRLQGYVKQLGITADFTKVPAKMLPMAKKMGFLKEKEQKGKKRGGFADI